MKKLEYEVSKSFHFKTHTDKHADINTYANVCMHTHTHYIDDPYSLKLKSKVTVV